MLDFTQIRCIWALAFLAFALWTSVRQRSTECITKRRLRVVFQNGAASATSDEAPWTSRRAAAGAAQGKVTECVMAPRGARTLRPRRPTAMPRRLGLVLLSDADNHDDVLSTAAGRCWCSCSAPRPPPGPAAGRMSPWRSERTAPAVGGAPPGRRQTGQCTCVRAPERSMSWSGIGFPHIGQSRDCGAGTGSSVYGPSGGAPRYGRSRSLNLSTAAPNPLPRGFPSSSLLPRVIVFSVRGK